MCPSATFLTPATLLCTQSELAIFTLRMHRTVNNSCRKDSDGDLDVPHRKPNKRRQPESDDSDDTNSRSIDDGDNMDRWSVVHDRSAPRCNIMEHCGLVAL